MAPSSPQQVAAGSPPNRRPVRRELFERGPLPASSVRSKWWRSCWNGQQLDGELLYETVKAQRERRLALSSGGPAERRQVAGRRPEVLVDGSRQSYVYAVPRALRRPSGGPTGGRSPSSSSSSSSAVPAPAPCSRPAPREDPLSDPLYASVLGTSKQLEALAGRRPPTSGRRPERQRELESALQLRSLVERCLEVQRATRNGNLLLRPAEDERVERAEEGVEEVEEEDEHLLEGCSEMSQSKM